MKLKLPRRRWVVLAGCLAVIGCGLVLMHVEEAQRRYQRMLASYERVRIGMTPSEVRVAVGQLRADKQVWDEKTTRKWQHSQTVAADFDAGPPSYPSSWDGWVDHDLIVLVVYRDGKAWSKNLVKTTRDWRAMADDWFARLSRLFS